MFHKASNIDPKTGKVMRSDELKNVRLHYTDIRGYTTRKLDNIMYAIDDLLHKIYNRSSFSYQDLIDIEAGINIIYSNILSIYKLIYESKDLKAPKDVRIEFSKKNIILAEYTAEELEKIVEKILYKLLKRYNHFIMNNVSKLYNIIETLKDHLLGGMSLYMMDMYLLKRLLDKDYVTNSVIYTGAEHSVNYIRLLVKYFDFKITHCAYLKDDNINKAEKYIKMSKDHRELNALFWPPELLQCSILRDWPKNFL
jgi:hypothetical protein